METPAPTPERRFEGTLVARKGGAASLPLPFDPDAAWGARERHHVTGTIAGCAVRGPLARSEEGWELPLGPAWLRNGLAPGSRVQVILAPEGPQWAALPPDLAAALEAEPEARAFFEALATFYRKGYLRWLDGAARRPAVREQRVQELVALLKAGKKTRDG